MGVTPAGVRGVATPHIMRCGGCQCIATPQNLKKFNSQNRIFCEYVLFICTGGWVNAKFSKWHFNIVNSTGPPAQDLAQRDHCKHWSLPPLILFTGGSALTPWHDCCWCSSTGPKWRAVSINGRTATGSMMMMMTSKPHTPETPCSVAGHLSVTWWHDTTTDQCWLRLMVNRLRDRQTL